MALGTSCTKHKVSYIFLLVTPGNFWWTLGDFKGRPVFLMCIMIKLESKSCSRKGRLTTRLTDGEID